MGFRVWFLVFIVVYALVSTCARETLSSITAFHPRFFFLRLFCPDPFLDLAYIPGLYARMALFFDETDFLFGSSFFFHSYPPASVRLLSLCVLFRFSLIYRLLVSWHEHCPDLSLRASGLFTFFYVFVYVAHNVDVTL